MKFLCSLIAALSLLPGLAFPSTEQVLRELASRYSEAIQIPNSKFLENTPQQLKRVQKQEDAIAQSLKSLDPKALLNEKQRIFYLKFKEYIEANIDSRVCRNELWQIDPIFNGAHILLNQVVESQPVTTNAEKKRALQQWESLADYYQQEIANLNEGLRLGYTAPKAVVQRVIEQINNIVAIDIGSHPYLKLAERSEDEIFQKSFKAVIQHQVLPALKAYVAYLQQHYLEKTRSELGLYANTDGRQCYLAKYRYYTSLHKKPEEVHELGIKTVSRHEQEVVAIAKRIYNVDSFEEAVLKAKRDDVQGFDSADSMHQFYQQVAARAEQAASQAFKALPAQRLKVEPIPLYLQDTGVSATYEAGKFIYDPAAYKTASRGHAEIVTVHEGYPGHHLQLALAKNQMLFHPIEKLFTTNAFREGWARYAETLSEELGIYQTNSALIYRRAWPARGLVVDTGLHMLGWSNEKVKAYMLRSGHIADPERLLVRMAAYPAQLTAYDSGALEIFTLRAMAQKQLGNRFDLKEFHRVVLKNGNVPLSLLRSQIEEWVSSYDGE